MSFDRCQTACSHTTPCSYDVSQVDTAVSEAVHGGDGSGSAATHTVANHTAAAAATAVLSTSRRLLSAALRSSGSAACAGALWSLQGGAATAWLLSSLRAGPGDYGFGCDMLAGCAAVSGALCSPPHPPQQYFSARALSPAAIALLESLRLRLCVCACLCLFINSVA